jgi:hypothetical protein
VSAQIGASVGIMFLLSIVEATTICKWQVLGSLGPPDIQISSSRGLEIVGTLNHLTMWGRESLSSRLRSWLKLWLSRIEHRSS